MKEKLYFPPCIEEIELKAEGVLCESVEDASITDWIEEEM